MSSVSPVDARDVDALLAAVGAALLPESAQALVAFWPGGDAGVTAGGCPPP